MTYLEIQSPPYSFYHTRLRLTMASEEQTCFIGEIDKLPLIKELVMGIFLKANGDTPAEGYTYLQAFCYDSPKHEYKTTDCPEATHILIKGNIEDNPTMDDYNTFLQGLATSDINKKMVTPAVDPFEHLYK